jgi:hypothetical protein
MPEDLFTLMLQRAVLGIESYLPSALRTVAAQLGSITHELCVQLDDPFALGGKQAVTNIYHRMPQLVHPELSLKFCDESLYERTRIFYREVRNPLFHGEQLADPTIEAIRCAYTHLAALYDWMDGWHDPDWFMKGFAAVSGLPSRFKQKI